QQSPLLSVLHQPRFLLVGDRHLILHPENVELGRPRLWHPESAQAHPRQQPRRKVGLRPRDGACNAYRSGRRVATQSRPPSSPECALCFPACPGAGQAVASPSRCRMDRARLALMLPRPSKILVVVPLLTLGCGTQSDADIPPELLEALRQRNGSDSYPPGPTGGE